MPEKIRNILESDFNEVSKLFDVDNSVEELKWLFSDPYNKGSYNAFVVENDKKEVLGTLGYMLLNLNQNDKNATMVTPMNWIVKSDYKGFAGVMLFKKVVEMQDAAFAIWGAPKARKLYPLFKFKHLLYSDMYYKVLRPFKYYSTLKGKKWLRRMGLVSFLIPSYFRHGPRAKSDAVELIPYNYENFAEESDYDGLFRKKMTKEYLDWLLACPSVEANAFVVRKDKEDLGVCILYKKTEGTTTKGRIVHLPFLGKHLELWQSTVDQCTAFLKQQGCCFVSVTAVHETVKSGLLASGYRMMKRHRQPIYLKDPKNSTNAFNFDNWHFQFSDGEMAIRNF